MKSESSTPNPCGERVARMKKTAAAIAILAGMGGWPSHGMAADEQAPRSLATVPPAAAWVRAGEAIRGRGDLVVELRDALWHAGKPEVRHTLRLCFEHDDSGWRPMAIGDSRTYNRGDHYGRLRESVADGEALRLTARMRIEPDPWAGGEALVEYRMSLRATNGVWRGAWECELRGQTGGGEATGVFRPAAPGFAPPAAGEHPRLLLRRSELDALREKARTDWGRAMLDRLAADDPSASNRAVGRALLYALTGDPEHAKRARELIRSDIDTGKWFEIGQVHDPAAKATEALIAYDLIHETCGEDFHAPMRALLREQAPWFYRGADCPLYNLNDGSNWSAMYNSGVGMVALYLSGEPAEPYIKPPEPVLPTLSPPADLVVGRDVPVVNLETGRLWSTWLWAGPFHAGRGLDALASIGGAARARPEHGTKVAWRVCADYAAEPDPAGEIEERIFAPLDAKFLVSEAHAKRYGHIAAEGAVDFAAATKQAGLTTSYLYAVIENDRPGCYRVDIGDWKLLDAAVDIAGHRCRDGDIVRLERGRYPVLGSARMAHVNTWTRIGYHVRLHVVTEDEAGSWLRARRARWEADAEDWQTDPYAARWLGVARRKIANWTAGALGDMGWNTEGEAYTRHSFRLVFPFAHCYRNVTGKDILPDSGLRHVLRMYTARTIFGADSARMTAFGPGGGPPGVDTYARGFSLVPAEDRGTVLWAWNRTQALADAGRLEAPEKLVDRLDPLSAAFRFVNYPLDSEEEHPSKRLANVMVEPRKGGYVFRNRWQDADDCVVTVYLDSNCAGGGWGSLETADLRIQGLGVDWTVRGMGWGHGGSWRDRSFPGTRYGQTVLFPSDPHEGGGEAALTFFEPRTDGSGVIGIDLNDIYTAGEPRHEGQARATPVRPGARTGYDTGIRGSRAIAVDYSGLCGAPALIAVADRIGGTAGTNTWQLVTPVEHAVTVGEGGFTIAAPNGATLRATVVAPVGATIATVERGFRHEINYHGGHAQMSYTRKLVEVRGGERFFVVMTVQHGQPPECGLADGSVTIGGRTVSVRDGNLDLGEVGGR